MRSFQAYNPAKSRTEWRSPQRLDDGGRGWSDRFSLDQVRQRIRLGYVATGLFRTTAPRPSHGKGAIKAGLR